MNILKSLQEYYPTCPVCNERCILTNSDTNDYCCENAYSHFTLSILKNNVYFRIKLSLENDNFKNEIYFVHHQGELKIYSTKQSSYKTYKLLSIKTDIEPWILPKDELIIKIAKLLLLG